MSNKPTPPHKWYLPTPYPKRRHFKWLAIVLCSILPIFAFAPLYPTFLHPTLHPTLHTDLSARFADLPSFPSLNPPTLSALLRRPVIVLRKQPQHPGSLGESLRLHTPFLLASADDTDALRPAAAPNATLSCSNYNPVTPIPLPTCREYLDRQQFGQSGLLHSSMQAAAPLHTTPTTCLDATPIFFALTTPVYPSQDVNICHFLMRILLAWHVVQRATHNPSYLPVSPRQVLVLICPDNMAICRHLRLPPKQSPGSLHKGLLHTLFISRGVPVVVVHSVSDLQPARCFRSGIILISFANRFAFPDAELGPDMGYGSAVSLPTPLSSDALALRDALFAPLKPPAMRRKLLYVARRASGRRSFEGAAEKAFRTMLRTVALEEGAELRVFEGHAPYPTFWAQVGLYADASVVVGFHGAGLALCVFAPREAAVVEIWPHGFKLGLFQNLKSYGLQHEEVLLRNGSQRTGFFKNLLFDEDRRILESVIRERLRERKV